MHRSGTSLVSSLLQKGGLDIGQHLLGAGTGNIKGHFEDLDFFHFHVQILELQGIHPTGFTLQREFQIREQHVLVARALVEERRRRLVPWGWKDPRTTLFLDFWQQTLPEANFLILYRSPWDVTDSLFRRGDEMFRSTPHFAVQVWIHYNQLLLDFHDRFAERCLCVNIYRAVQAPEVLLEALRSKFGLNLGPVADLYDASLLHRPASTRWASLLQYHYPEAVDLYEQLNARAAQRPFDGASLAPEPTTFLPIEDWALQDWLNLRVLEEQHREIRKQWEKAKAEVLLVRNELVEMQAQQTSHHEELVQARRKLEKARSELELVRGEAVQVRREAEQVRRETEQVKSEAVQFQADLGQAQAQLRSNQLQIANMQSSKFWKLRNAWMAAKHSLRRAG
jgi:hypothetical protein